MSTIRKHFPGQKEGEHIKLLVRKHWVMDIKSAAVLLTIGVIPFLAGIIITDLLWKVENPQVFWGFMMVFFTYLLIISYVIYVHWLNDELDIIIVTDQRVISHEQKDLFHRQISETNVSQIQDVKGIENGLFESIFHFGSLEIMTSSKDTFFIMNHVENPYENARKLLDIRDQAIIANNAR